MTLKCQGWPALPVEDLQPDGMHEHLSNSTNPNSRFDCQATVIEERAA